MLDIQAAGEQPPRCVSSVLPFPLVFSTFLASQVREGMDLSDVSLLEDMLVFRGSPPWFLRASVFW